MTGIYKITNILNGNSYIGLSKDIEKRWKYHKTQYNWTRENHKILYQAFQKYGIENFTFEVLEECEIENLGEREQFYIDKFQSNINGYNATAGGETNDGESHPGHKLLKQDVIDIRTRYDNLERKEEVYQLYKNKIGISGFHKIWNGQTWQGIMMEVYTEENKKFHLHNSGNKGSKNGRTRLSEQDVRNIRLRRKNNENVNEVYKDYSDKLTFGSFKNIWSY